MRRGLRRTLFADGLRDATVLQPCSGRRPPSSLLKDSSAFGSCSARQCTRGSTFSFSCKALIACGRQVCAGSAKLSAPSEDCTSG